MSLDTSGDAKKIGDFATGFIANNPPNPNREILDVVQTVLDNGFQVATKSGENFDITPPAGSLFINLVSGDTMPDEIGRACAEYWSKAIAIGAPEVCQDEVVSVSNDAGKIAAPIASGLRALGDAVPKTPIYFDFVNVIHTNVKTIVWTIVEDNKDGSCSSTVTGNVS